MHTKDEGSTADRNKLDSLDNNVKLVGCRLVSLPAIKAQYKEMSRLNKKAKIF